MSMLTRWNPISEIQAMQNMMDRFWSDFAANFSMDTAQPFAAPAIDIIDAEDHIEVRADLPGIPPENVNIEFKNGALVISASVEREETKEGETFTRRERYQGSYQRSLSVPDSLDVAKAEATFENGVLTLSIPRKPEAQPVKIAVKSPKLIEGKKK